MHSEHNPGCGIHNCPQCNPKPVPKGVTSTTITTTYTPVADEPIARVAGYYGGRCVIEPVNKAMVLPYNMALYDRPQPAREWVSLTDEEMRKVCSDWDITAGGWAIGFIRSIEAKLKEKNT